MYRYVYRCYEFKLLLAVFELLLHELDRDGFEIHLHVFGVVD